MRQVKMLWDEVWYDAHVISSNPDCIIRPDCPTHVLTVLRVLTVLHYVLTVLHAAGGDVMGRSVVRSTRHRLQPGNLSSEGAPPPETLHPAAHTLRLTPYTLHPTTCTLHLTPYTLHPTPSILHPTPYTLHHTPYTLHS